MRTATAPTFLASPVHCAYNQTRECFLALEVLATELSFANIGDILAKQTFKSGEGIWLKPFHGIPTTDLYAPLDLIYLDSDCRVIELVESFPTFLATSVISRPASVLVLPAHSIYSSQTQPGDQLILCVAEEMEMRLERLASGSEDMGVLQGAVVLREQPLWSGGPGLVELESQAITLSGNQGEAHEISLIERRCSKGALRARHQRNRLVCCDRRAVVSRHAHPDDTSKYSRRRRNCRAFHLCSVASGSLGQRRRRLAVCYQTG